MNGSDSVCYLHLTSAPFWFIGFCFSPLFLPEIEHFFTINVALIQIKSSRYPWIWDKYCNIYRTAFKSQPVIGPKLHNHFPTLLQQKLILSAIRLSTKPVAFILDEPSWGLSKESSYALVLAILEYASKCDIPILIITQKKWWDSIARSTSYFKKQELPNCDDVQFNIKLEVVNND